MSVLQRRQGDNHIGPPLRRLRTTPRGLLLGCNPGLNKRVAGGDPLVHFLHLISQIPQPLHFLDKLINVQRTEGLINLQFLDAYRQCLEDIRRLLRG